MRIYCGNLPFSATEDDVRSMFEEYGTVHSVDLMYDRESGRPRGFGFVDMDDSGAPAAIEALDGLMYGGRNLRINEARPREENRGGGGRREGDGGYRRDSGGRRPSSGSRRY
jgi:RNA recognition motif-containing protein